MEGQYGPIKHNLYRLMTPHFYTMLQVKVQVFSRSPPVFMWAHNIYDWYHHLSMERCYCWYKCDIVYSDVLMLILLQSTIYLYNNTWEDNDSSRGSCVMAALDNVFLNSIVFDSNAFRKNTAENGAALELSGYISIEMSHYNEAYSNEVILYWVL